MLVGNHLLCSVEQIERHEVKAGITGWAQAHGRNAITWEIKFELGPRCVGNICIWLDTHVLMKALAKLLSRREGNRAHFNTTADFYVGATGRI